MTLNYTKMKKTVLLLLTFILSASISYSQIPRRITPKDSIKQNSLLKKSTTVWQDIGSDFMTFLGDAGNYYTLPFHTSFKGWLFDAAGIGSSLSLMWADKSLKNRLKCLQQLLNN